jgi:hypothetical protein
MPEDSGLEADSVKDIPPKQVIVEQCATCAPMQLVDAAERDDSDDPEDGNDNKGGAASET